MPMFKVYRDKRYEASVDAKNETEAHDKAMDLSGREWLLVEDVVLPDVVRVGIFDDAS